jgi:hypothetical protein
MPNPESSEARRVRGDDGTANQPALHRLHQKILAAADEIERLRAENVDLRRELETTKSVGSLELPGLPEDPDERREMLDSLIATIDFYLKRDS